MHYQARITYVPDSSRDQERLTFVSSLSINELPFVEVVISRSEVRHNMHVGFRD